MTTNTIISVADYYGTKGARELVHRVKNNDVEAIAIMARVMAEIALERLPADSVLIPVPSHTGHATNTLQLAAQIALLTGFPVLDIVRGRMRNSWYTLKQNGVTASRITDAFFGFYLVDVIKHKTPVIVDNVFDTGQTIVTISKLFCQPIIVLTYASTVR
ncbi:MAG: hypothetical protein HRT35_06110 [Algicola sp.]|nr:hypothetical protein [Algicola sp.]